MAHSIGNWGRALQSLYDTTNDLPKLIFSSKAGLIDPILYEKFLAEGKKQ
jgi:hypothetical protein